MSLMVAEIPTLLKATNIERRAKKISDPLERLRYLRHATAPKSHRYFRHRWRWLAPAVLAVAIVPLASDANVPGLQALKLPPMAMRKTGSDLPNVWLVEHTNESELYSNGLQIDNRLAITNEPRAYSLLSRESGGPLGPLRYQPAGIVFHTSESDQAPFEASQSRTLKRIAHDLLLYIRHKRAYHFLIDRFGRVHRIVVESDTANHAGRSVWADSRWVYLDLNASFLGVAFEASTYANEHINQAEIHAAKVLTEMLRSKYRMPVENCVTHAQVSVNPDNMRLGWHTDWGANFPFKDIGLQDNYEQPNPSLYLFGFGYDPVYMKSTSPELWKGLAQAEEGVREAAAEHGVSVAEYRRSLQKKYREQISALRYRGATEENDHEPN